MQFVTNRFGDTSSALGYLGRLLLKTTLSVKSCGLVEGVASKLPILRSRKLSIGQVRSALARLTLWPNLYNILDALLAKGEAEPAG
jgi:hypothetical protein